MQNTVKTCTIATYNIFDGRRKEQIIENILKLIHNGAHIICLQEVWYTYRGVSMSKLIDENLPRNFQSYYFLGDKTDPYSYGQGILWNTETFSAIGFDKLPLPPKNGLTLSDKLFFWAVGLSPRIFKRGALIGTFMFGQHRIRISNIHLDFQGGDVQRIKQLQAVTDYLGSLPAVDSEIVCGDFNTVGILGKKKKIIALEKLLGAGFKSVVHRPYISAIIQQLDYIFIKNLKIKNTKILKLRGSDHFPLLAEVSV